MPVTTKLDLDRAREAGLKICAKCGWYEHGFRPDECDPELGAIADKLALQCGPLMMSRLGFGFGYVSFELADGLGFTLAVYRNGTFDLRSIHCIPDLSQEQVLALAHAIKQIVGGK